MRGVNVALLLFLLLAGALMGCATGGGYSSAPIFHCDHLKDAYRERDVFKAMVVSTYRGGGCYQSWNRNSTGDAVEDALQFCRKENPGNESECLLLHVNNFFGTNTDLSVNCRPAMDSYLDSEKEFNKAMAMADRAGGGCHIVWGRSTPAEAIEDALEKCWDANPDHKAYCTIVAYDNHVSRVAAYSGGNSGGGSFLTDLNNALSVLNSGIGAVNAIRGMNQGRPAVPTPAYTPSTRAGSTGGTSSDVCRKLYDNAQQCLRDRDNMRSLGNTGKHGTEGQAGAFNDCYNLYMNAYRAQCQ